MTEVQELVARLRLRDDFTGPLRKVRSGISGLSDQLRSPRFTKAISQVGTGLKTSFGLAAIGIGLFTTQVIAGFNSLVKLEKAQAQTNAVITSTKGIAGITAEQVGKLAEKYESLNAQIGDETVRAGANMLLTFTNIRKKAFEPALEAVLNMNTAMGKGPEGLTTTAILVGKALNDPTKGMTALRRVGVAFTDAQVKKIKSLQKEGKLYEAQAIIIKELNTEFGGSFLGQGATTAGKVAKFTDSIEDLQRALATALLPTVGKIADRLSTFLADPKVVKGISDLGKDIGTLFSDKNLDKGAAIFRDVFKAAKDAAPTIRDAMVITGNVVRTAVQAFQSLPPEIQKLAIGAAVVNKLTGGLVTNIAGGLISAVLKQLVSGVVNVNGAVVNVVGGGGGLPGGGGVPGGGKGGGGVVGAIAKVAIVAAAPAVLFELASAAMGGPAGINARAAEGRALTAAARGIPQQTAAAIAAKGLPITSLPPHISELERATAQAVRNAQIGITGSTEGIRRNTGTAITAAAAIKTAVDRAKASTLDGARASASTIAAAVRNKKTTLTVNVSNQVSVDTRKVVNSTARYRVVAA